MLIFEVLDYEGREDRSEGGSWREELSTFNYGRKELLVGERCPPLLKFHFLLCNI